MSRDPESLAWRRFVRSREREHQAATRVILAAATVADAYQPTHTIRDLRAAVKRWRQAVARLEADHESHDRVSRRSVAAYEKRAMRPRKGTP